jgi:hypothetical protein
MWTPVVNMPIPQYPGPIARAAPQFLSYALGWGISDYHGHRMVSHGGGEGAGRVCRQARNRYSRLNSYRSEDKTDKKILKNSTELTPDQVRGFLQLRLVKLRADRFTVWPGSHYFLPR